MNKKTILVLTAGTGVSERHSKVSVRSKDLLAEEIQRLFELDNIALEFEQGAYEAIAKLAIERKTGARGLRGIIEDLLSKLMFDSPSDPTIERIVISRGCVEKTEEPLIIHRGETVALPEAKNPA